MTPLSFLHSVADSDEGIEFVEKDDDESGLGKLSSRLNAQVAASKRGEEKGSGEADEDDDGEEECESVALRCVDLWGST